MLEVESYPLSLFDLSEEVHIELLRDGFQLYDRGLQSEPMSRSSAKRRLTALILSEFCTEGYTRISLEALGLARVDYNTKSLRQVVKAVGDTSDKVAPYAEELVRFLLDLIRRSRSITDLDKLLDLTDSSIWGEGQSQENRCWTIRREGPSKLAKTLIPHGAQPNRAVWFLVSRLGLERGEAESILSSFWDEATRSRTGLLARHGTGRALDLSRLVFTKAESEPLYICNQCGTRSQRSVNDACSAWKCEGTLGELSEEQRTLMAERNHYIARYRSRPLSALAREHTAAIGVQRREYIEEKFREGKLNLLSCTTTMEMGVDLGDLEAIFCKNVPPGIANYQQRSGRAGRRAQVAPVVLTSARNSRYDQSRYRDFGGFLNLRPAIPYLTLDNPDFFRRHQVSTVLSRFLTEALANCTRPGAPRLVDVFGSIMDDAAELEFRTSFADWLDGPIGIDGLAEAELLRETLPASLRPVGLAGTDLQDRVQKVVVRFSKDLSSQWTALDESAQEFRKIESDESADMAARNSARWQLNYKEKEKSQLLDQFLVTALSRAAVIPTYSFPVHSIRLEITEKRGASADHGAGVDATLQLDRDAALAIGEYAPGAEVVAGGRIWTSRGIVRRAREFMPTRFYRICDSCQHPDIRDQREQILDLCPQCGAISTSRRHSFIEPTAFITAYDESAGRDPGSSRLRQRSIDEARLLTHAPFAAFDDTDIAGIRTFFAPAQPTAGESQGRLFVVNRGTKGFGYLWCSKCEHAQAAPTLMEEVEAKHKNPRTGEECSVQRLRYSTDLGHVFETDIRAIAFSRTIPAFNDAFDDLERKGKRKGFLRTLTEAIRIAAARLLEADVRDLRATYEFRNQRPSVVLSDSVAGGAGYVRRLLDEGAFSAGALIEESIEVLSCAAECSSSCVKCLNDYGNQAYWDDFDRHPVLGWVRTLMKEESLRPDNVPITAKPWMEPTIGGLRERLLGASTVVLTAPALQGSRNREEALEAAKLLRDFSESESSRQIHLFVSSGVPIQPASLSSSDREAIYTLAQLEKNGRLDIFTVTDSVLQTMPRIAADTSGGGMAVFSTQSDRPLLDALAPGPAFVAGLESAPEWMLTPGKENGQLQKNALGGVLSDTSAFRHRPGKSRDFPKMFGSLSEKTTRLTIRDPYLAKGYRNRRAIANFVEMLLEQDVEIELLELVWRADRQGDGFRKDYEDPGTQLRKLQGELQDIGFDLTKVRLMHVPPRSGQHFHDRTIDAKIGSAQPYRQLRWDVTAGIDNLMDKSKECSVFLTEL